MPSSNSEENVHDPVVAVAVNVQVTGVPLAGVAVTVTVAPTVKPAKSNVGVLSEVVLSEFVEPVSDALAKTGAGVGVAGTTVKVPLEAAERLPAASTEYAL